VSNNWTRHSLNKQFLNHSVFLSFIVKPRVSTFLAVIDVDRAVMHLKWFLKARINNLNQI
jgi:hypothetical protein